MEPEEGTKFGKLTLIKYLEPIRDNSGSLRKIAEVRCDCGNTCVKKLKYLKNGETTSCGSCIKIAVCKPLKGVGDVFKVEPFSDEVDMIGTKVNRWTIVDVGFRFKKSRMMMSVCECGTERMVSKQSLLSGHSVSCGCYSSEVTTNMNTRHGLFWYSISHSLVKYDTTVHQSKQRGLSQLWWKGDCNFRRLAYI